VSSADRYIVAGVNSWSRRVFDERISKLDGEWFFIGDRDQLTIELIEKLAPLRIYFLHWSWKVPTEIIDTQECVVFHMTDVPYGRGGSPLQNLIQLGHRTTKVSAIRMTDVLDAGPVYCKKDLSLEGGAEEIYMRAARLSGDMIEEINLENPEPVPQEGTPTVFSRRKPEESRIERDGSLDDLFDFIRMLDADGYPPAFLEHGGFRYSFSRAALYDGRIRTDVEITSLVDGGPR